MGIDATRILFNAEPFGFGPSAAIAAIAPYFLGSGPHAYAGEQHSLDLQKHLPYQTIFNMTGHGLEDWDNTISGFDIVITAMDLDIANRSLSMGKRVVFYDALTWHWHAETQWPGIEALIHHPRALYIAQDFIGVRERLEDIEPNHYSIVPPITPHVTERHPRNTSDFVLLNLGGLKNPYIDDALLIDFARAITFALRQALGQGVKLHIVTSETIANALESTDAAPYPPEKVSRMLQHCTFAVCTPGLGNIYESAVAQTPVIWLPPVNDTQGLQLAHLRNAGLVDAELSWEMLGIPIDYTAPLQTCLDSIGDAISTLGCPERRAALDKEMADAVTYIGKCKKGRTFPLIERFGSGGDAVAAQKIKEWIETSGQGDCQ
ncbi:hypothetical protein [Pseudomonas viridiflava]|uniref:hypothetical protein n=1 Tax=Pseudomonas viridiflava TaxID=33069 RepID=UPI000F0314D2|nr:hypothetical protein [Pseudomonas viridiflava]